MLLAVLMDTVVISRSGTGRVVVYIEQAESRSVEEVPSVRIVHRITKPSALQETRVSDEKSTQLIRLADDRLGRLRPVIAHLSKVANLKQSQAGLVTLSGDGEHPDSANGNPLSVTFISMLWELLSRLVFC